MKIARRLVGRRPWGEPKSRAARVAAAEARAHLAAMNRREVLGVALAAGVAGSSPAGAAPAKVALRRLGRTGVQVSMLGLGGHHIGRPKEEKEGIRLVRMAIDNGITFLDNCWDYNGGRSEEWMGKALRGGYRTRAFLMTKLDGRTKKAAAEQLDQSLRRLQTDVIDLVQIHEIIRSEDPGRCFAEDGAMQALLEAKKAGKLRFIGFTGHKDPKIHLAMIEAGLARSFTFDAVQLPLNPMDAHYRSFEKEVLPVCQKHDIGVLGMKPMGDGHLLQSKVVDARECLRYALSLPISVVITGCERVPILQQAIDVGRSFQPMTEAERTALLARTAKIAATGKYEPFKNTGQFDGTAKNPHWLETARL
jgi:aryl-alcohol dehydrogenase-like predicted oxidoreductase